MTNIEAMKQHMKEWVQFLKARSDNGQHMQIPSGLSAGACFDLAVELEKFIAATEESSAVQEPVAWMRTSGTGSPVVTDELLIAMPEMRWNFQQPLYTHPQPKAAQIDAEWLARRTEASFEAGRQQGMKQERALWELARIGQEIEAEQEPKREPLTDERITSLRWDNLKDEAGNFLTFARAIEAAHGIKGEA